MNMNEILNRYFEGETSLEEERRLKAYFAAGEVEEDHKVYSDLFSCFKEESVVGFEGEDSIDLVLEKYFEGETSIEEERRLKSYFASGEVSEDHKVYNDLFSCFEEESVIAYEGEDNLDLVLEKYFKGETSIAEEQRLKTYFNGGKIADKHKEFTPLFNFYSISQTEVLEKTIDIKRAKTLHIVRRTMVGIAAGLAILLGSVFVMDTYNNTQDEEVIVLTQDEKDAAEALETTKEALAFLGIQFNKGTESLDQLKNLKKANIFKN